MSTSPAPTAQMLDAALTYAEHGAPVFPIWWIKDGHCACGDRTCEQVGKHPVGPVVRHGVLDATTNAEMIRVWWSRCPSANIATSTNWSTVLDVDPRHGGDDALAALEREHGPLPDTAEVLTGGGGRHVYFRPVPDLPASTGKVGPGLDVKTGPGAYVLLPPSAHISGGQYLDEILHPLFDTPLAEMPAWLVELARKETTEQSGNGHQRTPDEWAERLIGAPEGQRRANALEVAGHYLGLRIAPAEVEAILVGFAARCTPPFPEREAREIVRDLARRDRAKERSKTDNVTLARPDGNAPVASSVRQENAESGADGAAGLGLVHVGELLNEPDDEHTYIVEKRLPAAGLGLLAGKPKAGKSTAARCLAFAVARGVAWLGHATTQGPVIYMALEEKRAEVRDHFRDLGATAADPIYVFCEAAPLDALDRLRVEAVRLHPVLIIIDPLFRFVRVDDGNDYATMTAALEPLLVLARETGAHVLLVHHLGKGERSDGDNVLGSTAIFGAVDTALLMKRTERYRTLSSIQRYGEDLEEITIDLDPVTRNVSAGATRAVAEQAEAERQIQKFLGGATEPVTEPVLAAEIECRTEAQRVALRAMVKSGKVARLGAGRRGDPFRYVLAESREQESPERVGV